MSAFTPKELRRIAQGCRVSRLPWVTGPNGSCTLKGFRQKGSVIREFLERHKIEDDEKYVWD